MIRRFLLHARLTQRILFAIAIAMLAYCASVLMDAWVFQNAESHELNRFLSETPSSGSPERSLTMTQDLIGRIDIPRLSLSVIVMEGTSTTTLRHAAGHIAGTALPGHPGNVGISAHRDTFFRPLRNIRQNDIITLTTLLGEFRYRVVSTKIVSPYGIAVLDGSANQILTLVTCYPFYFIGSAPDRFIVRAERVT